MFGKLVRIAASPAALAACAIAMLAAPRTFVPDVTFTGSSLSDWHTVGQANWKAENGEIVGTPTSAEGGWLVLNEPFQDLGSSRTFAARGAAKRRSWCVPRRPVTAG